MDRNIIRAVFAEELEYISRDFPELFKPDFQKIFAIALDRVSPNISQALDEDTLFEIFFEAFESF